VEKSLSRSLANVSGCMGETILALMFAVEAKDGIDV
jgi:hypothetical protein